VPRKVARILLWFVLPLTLLVVADRLWMWTKWLRRRKKGNNEQGSQEIGNNPKLTTKTKEQ
jgi:cytochrome c-type biogenesis protein CcmH/NrfF